MSKKKRRRKDIEILGDFAERLLKKDTCDCFRLKAKCICNPKPVKKEKTSTNNTSNTHHDGGVNSDK
jgi:hypothetical protein